MPTPRTALLLLGQLLLVSCCRQFDDEARRRVETEVHQMLTASFLEVKSEGMLAELQYLDASDDFFWVPPGARSAISYDSLRSLLHQEALAYQSVTLYWDTLTVTALSPYIATYSGIVRGAMLDTTYGLASVAVIETGTAIRRPDGWKIVSGQSRNLD